ncbi:hypothetical protein AXG93_2637s1000 [Marchantia polymorpha subsp. ruderalis]|uniref:Protein kinase domain-containing protein n=1 Tax=Marchantia polymorpha subsp. ruderalis TaxID=1480154 RepID=A0A176VEV8_MARPO|nr:hypothetical protein AXG93_2637s1000 [Marchantia polymorpha subsp. ruderalis]
MSSDISIRADELGRGLFDELDYTLGAANAIALKTAHAKLSYVKSQCEAKVVLGNLVKKEVESSLVQLLETGVMHADPHPENLLFTKDGNLTYLDFGLICHMEKSLQVAMLAAISHLVNGDWVYLANDLDDMNVLKPTTNRYALRLALERVCGDSSDTGLLTVG